MKKLAVVALLGLLSSEAFTKSIFIMSKSIRQKNVIHYDVKTKDCRMTDKPLSAYWILGEKQGQVQQLTPDEVKKFAPKIVRENGHELEFTLPAFEEVDDPIVDHPILVKLVDCEPKAFVRLNGEEIQLNEIHAKISILKMGVSYLLIKGKRANGSAITHKVDA